MKELPNMQGQPISLDMVRRVRTQQLARRFLIEAAHVDFSEAAFPVTVPLVAGFCRTEGGFQVVISTDLTIVEQRIAAACCAVRTLGGESIDGVSRATFDRVCGLLLETAIRSGRSLDRVVNEDMLGIVGGQQQ
jgi:hypothetical protein